MTPPPKFGKNESEWEKKKKKNIQRKQENFSGSLLLQ